MGPKPIKLADAILQVNICGRTTTSRLEFHAHTHRGLPPRWLDDDELSMATFQMQTLMQESKETEIAATDMTSVEFFTWYIR
jgi:hypothetical protein